MIDNRVACIIVTYNRKKMLLECLDAIINQIKKPEVVYIIDNASTDFTYEILSENGFMNNNKNDINFVYNRMEKNIGGAGGFYEGLKLAFDNKYELFWMMDDDGVPKNDSLEKLLEYVDYYDIVSSLVINKNNLDELSFGLAGCDTKKNIVEKYNKIVENEINPFNGTLVSRKVINTIGFIKKEMFIWGDETEYVLRAKSKDLKIATVIDSIHYHPKGKSKKYYILNNKYVVSYPDELIKRYCFYRNYAYILYNYKKNDLIKYILKYTYFFLVYLKFDIKGFIFFIGCLIDGILDDFTKHSRYL